MNLEEFIEYTIKEDLNDEVDHTSHACIKNTNHTTAQLLIKDSGIIAGVELAELIFNKLDPKLQFEKILNDGDIVKPGQIAFKVTGPPISILTSERTVLNCMQRMSGIATTTAQYVEKIQKYKSKILDTRKTTPLMRYLEKWAVRIGGGFNHRFGLYDMILIKDNHVDYAGGISNALMLVKKYLQTNKLNLKVEIETRNLIEVREVLKFDIADRIMLDNFAPAEIKNALDEIDGRTETEASGGINLNSIEAYAKTGVDYISVGALTHSVKSLDMSLKAAI